MEVGRIQTEPEVLGFPTPPRPQVRIVGGGQCLWSEGWAVNEVPRCPSQPGKLYILFLSL